MLTISCAEEKKGSVNENIPITVLITGRVQARHNIGKRKINQRKFIVVICVRIFGRAQKAGFKGISRDAALYRFLMGISSTSICSHYFPFHHFFLAKSSVRMAIREVPTSSQYFVTFSKAHVANEVFTYRCFNWMPSACSDRVIRNWSSSSSSFVFSNLDFQSKIQIFFLMHLQYWFSSVSFFFFFQWNFHFLFILYFRIFLSYF